MKGTEAAEGPTGVNLSFHRLMSFSNENVGEVSTNTISKFQSFLYSETSFSAFNSISGLPNKLVICETTLFRGLNRFKL